MKANPEWVKELQIMVSTKVKAEIQVGRWQSHVLECTSLRSNVMCACMLATLAPGASISDVFSGCCRRCRHLASSI